MTEDIEPFIEEHLAVYRVKHKNKFRNLISTQLGHQINNHRLKADAVIIARPRKSREKLQISSKIKGKSTWNDLPPLNDLFEFLSENAFVPELYRKPGRRQRTVELEDKIRRGSPIDWPQINALDAADTLKRLIRVLKYPLLPLGIQEILKQTANLAENLAISQDDAISLLRSLFLCIPSNSRILSARLFRLLLLTSQSSANPEAATALATIFLPCLLTSLSPPELRLSTYRDLIKFVIENYEQIYQIPKWLKPELQQMCPNCTDTCPLYRTSELHGVRRLFRWRSKSPRRLKEKNSNISATLPRGYSRSLQVDCGRTRTNSWSEK